MPTKCRICDFCNAPTGGKDLVPFFQFQICPECLVQHYYKAALHEASHMVVALSFGCINAMAWTDPWPTPKDVKERTKGEQNEHITGWCTYDRPKTLTTEEKLIIAVAPAAAAAITDNVWPDPNCCEIGGEGDEIDIQLLLGGKLGKYRLEHRKQCLKKALEILSNHLDSLDDIAWDIARGVEKIYNPDFLNRP